MIEPEYPHRGRRFPTLLVAALFIAAGVAGVLTARQPAVVRQPPEAVPPAPEALVGPGPALQLQNMPFPMPPELVGVDLNQQNDAAVAAKSDGCVMCHRDQHDPHFKKSVHLGCTDCHGGHMPSVTQEMVQAAQAPRQPGECRHCPAAPPTQNPGAWINSAGPVRSYTLLNFESPDFVRFVNPGDLRIAHISCGTTNCHPKVISQVRKSMMTHGCMLWGAALYNNGSVPYKVPRHGEFYSMTGVPLRAQTVPPPDDFETQRGVIPYLEPLPRFEITQPGNILRIFERGGKIRPEVGIPNPKADPGNPFLERLSNRGLGTDVRTDPVFLGLQKTRLFNPTLNMLGTNDQPGDYRGSGCTACHVIYANDRSEVNSSTLYAKYGSRGMASSDAADHPDPTIPKNESAHPIEHRFTPGNAIPTSQCMTCHVHPGTTVMNSYTGNMWWDLETDGELMYPAKQKHPTAEEFIRTISANPEETAVRGNWGDPDFLANVTDLNMLTKHSQFADFHSHGWVFRAVFRQDRKGNLLDYQGKVVTDLSNANMRRGVDIVKELKKPYIDDGAGDSARHSREMAMAHERAGVPMQLVDIHVEKGMHCIDCHFVQDNHGNERLQMEVRAAVEIQCIDCHGTATKRATLRTTGPASYTSNPEARTGPQSGRTLAGLRTPTGKPRFEQIGDRIYQRSMVEPNLRWEVTQTVDTLDPDNSHYNKRSALAKTVHFEGDQLAWGKVPETPEKDDSKCAHANKNMSCISCHSSWNPSCFGCHLPQRANMKAPMLSNTGDVTRNLHTYDFQTLRQDTFMLARDGMATGNRINPSRSSCAVHVTSYNQNRENVYYQQQTISGEGYSGIAFSTNVPHTVSGQDTKQCTDCHVSAKNDNNAVVAQLLMHGTGYMNFIGRYAWMAAGEHGLYAVEVTERDEPQAVVGSYLHHLAFPENFAKHVECDRMLEHAYEHPGKDISDNIIHPFRKNEVLGVQLRGEYLYAACGEAGLRVFDVAFTDHKGFSERFNTAPVSPCGQRFFVETKYATAVGAPVTTAPDPTRTHYVENKEGSVHSMYAYLYVCDKYEGLILVGAGTVLDGDPLNNFLKRDLTFNPDGILCGARAITFVGTNAYVLADAGLVVIDLNDPKEPKVKHVIHAESEGHAEHAASGEKHEEHPLLKHPEALACQFRYCYVADEEGIKIFDITDPQKPVGKTKIAIPDVHSIYLARTYAYLAAGKKGLVILDIENPQQPKVDQVFNAGGCINDLHDVKLGIAYSSQFAYLADGKNGMRIVQLTNPDTPGNQGFSPRPTPELIATYKIPHGGHALAISRGVDRDRAVDESGNQLSVFGRVGARPFNLEEQRKMFLHNGKLWTVSDDPDWSGYHRR